METDKRYFIQGLFVIGLSIATAFFLVWLAKSGHRDDVLYRIYFNESVTGLAPGDPVKFRGVDVGNVKSMAIDLADPRLVQVDVSLRKDAPIKTDTRATLKLKGFTGVVTVELSGGSVNAKNLADVTPNGAIPEIASEKSSLTTVLDELPKAVEKFTAIEDQSKKVLSDVNSLTNKLKDNPSLLIFPPKEKSTVPRSETGQVRPPNH